MKYKKIVQAVLVLFVATLLAIPAPAWADDSVSVQFGQGGETGAERNRIVPGTVEIEEEGEVDFEIIGFHQIAIYRPGIGPMDIDTMLRDANQAFLIDDPNGRIALSPPPNTVSSWTADDDLFEEPGRYLVICTVVGHFVEDHMYGWIVVQGDDDGDDDDDDGDDGDDDDDDDDENDDDD